MSNIYLNSDWLVPLDVMAISKMTNMISLEKVKLLFFENMFAFILCSHSSIVYAFSKENIQLKE